MGEVEKKEWIKERVWTKEPSNSTKVNSKRKRERVGLGLGVGPPL